MRPVPEKATLRILVEKWRHKVLEAQASFTARSAASPPYNTQVPSPLISDPLVCLPAHQWPEAKDSCGPEDPIWHIQKCSRKGERQLIAIQCVVLVLLLTCFSIHYFASSDFPAVFPCPRGWPEQAGRCYFFSNMEASWIFSQSNCSSFGSSLVTFDTQEEMDFVIAVKTHQYNWIGLQREDVKQPWYLPNDSVFNDRFPIGGEGRCAYLNEDEVSSTWCDNRRYWICRKP